MKQSLVHEVFSAVVAILLAAIAGAADTSRLGNQVEESTEGRSSLADKAEASVGNGTRPPSSSQSEVAGRGSIGRDISWPNCPTGMGIPERRTLGKPLPPPGSNYVIIGLTNGPGFYPNPCLAEQVAYARQLRLLAAAYAVVTYPTRSELRRYGDAGPNASTNRQGQLRNTGWAQAQMNVANMRAAGLEPPIIWVDVEPVSPPTPWSSDIDANRFVLEGAIRGYRAAGPEVGVYSTTYLWQTIVGAVSYGLPEWRTAGQTTKAKALAMCTGSSIQGGDAILAQWFSVDVDFNVLCPGRPAVDVLREYFTLP